ncbi:MAG: ABC transporter permease [Acidobacteriia bacterium]|nr:ABC transporter permease [Terriglobia bacterium]
MWRDFQYGWRLLRRSPGFTAVAVLTLALGIGANTAMFSVLEAVLLRPPAYSDPGRLVVLQRYYLQQRKTAEQLSAPDFKDFAERNRSLESLAVYASDMVTLTGGDEPQSLLSTAISANLAATLGAAPLLGRGFQTEDVQPGAPFTVLLSESLWRRQFASDPAVLGRRITLDGAPVRIVGVMPASFAFPEPSTAIWLPLRISPRDLTRRNVYWLRTVGRLKSGVSLAAAAKDLDSVAAQLAADYPKTNRGEGVSVVTLQHYLAGDSRRMLLVLGGAVGFVLLMVCANLASLLLARASARTSEFAVRSALGAARRQLLGQLLAEGILLSAIGGIAGILVAAWGVAGLRAVAMEQFSRASEILMDSGVLTFALGASLLCGIVFGLAPAWTATRDTLARSSARTTAGGGSARAVLVTAEVAMAFVLLAGAGLLTQSLWRLRHVNPGFVADHVQTFQIAPQRARFKTNNQVGAFYEELLSHIRAIPGVKAAGAVGNIPLSGERSGTGIVVENRTSAPGENLEANYQLAGPGYFSAMGIPLLAGRDFNPHDVEGAPEVVVVNRALAELCWPGQDAIGRRIRLGPNPKQPWSMVVGVIGDVRHDQLALPPRPEAYEDYFQHNWGLMSLMVRYEPAAAGVQAAIRAQIKLADKNIPIPPALSMDDVISTSLRDRRFLMWMLVGFAACATLLAAIGIYGVIAYSVTARTREIGIRVALGAERRDVTRLVLASGMRMAAAGVAFGGLAALGLMRLLRSMLFEVSPGDPATLALAASVLVVVALLGCTIPALRATRVEASVALRHE